jgi:hypothetical protein
MKIVKHSSETPSIPAHLILVPAANAVVNMEDGEAVLEERRAVVAVPQVQQATQQETSEVTQTDLGGQGLGQERTRCEF